MSVPTYLDTILAAHRAHEGPARPGNADLLAGPVRPFREALEGSGLSVIAEVKRRSPSKGDLAPDVDPALLARRYEDGGAACVSVLTDEHFFGGSPADLIAARAACTVPVLRKDFTVREDDVRAARAMGADAVLLIVAALDDHELAAFHTLAIELGMAALVEVHDEHELDRALAAGATIVGVNQRDLSTFEVDTERAVRVAKSIPDVVVKVAESGIRTRDDAVRVASAGYDAVLVGEALVCAADPGSVIGELRSACS